MPTNIERYHAVQEERTKLRLQIIDALDAAGLAGVHELHRAEALNTEIDRVWREMSHAERMEILDEDKKRTDALLARTARCVCRERNCDMPHDQCECGCPKSYVCNGANVNA